jgi:hypothetical protein
MNNWRNEGPAVLETGSGRIGKSNSADRPEYIAMQTRACKQFQDISIAYPKKRLYVEKTIE